MQINFLLKLISVFLFGVLAFGKVHSQSITLSGRVMDKADKTILIGATVKLIAQKDSTQNSVQVTDSKGNVAFDNLSPDTYTIKISMSGYEKIQQKVKLLASNNQPVLFLLNRLSTELANVTVVAKAPPVRLKGDTTEFSADQFKVNPDATAEDLIKKLPGITVAKDGTVTTMGEQVQKVTVDGKDFFGNDATAALKNLPADIIDKIQVFDKLSDQAQLTGFDDGNSIKTVNIVTKAGIKNGQFGRVFAGIGTEGTAGGKETYNAGGNMSFFEGDRRISLVANFNNINQQNFSSQDLLGATSSGGGRGGGGGGNGSYGGGAGSNFNVGQVSGVSKTNAFGINFSNAYAKKVTVSGSYFFNNSTNTNQSLSNTETFLDPKNLYSIQNSNATTANTNHRINMRIEYKIDSFNSVFIIPSLSFQKTNTTSQSIAQNYYDANDSTSISTGESTSDKKGYNVANNILFRHAFAKRGRTLSFGFNTGWTENDGTGINDVSYKFFNNAIVTDSTQNRYSISKTMGNTIGGNIAYTEPIGKKGQIQISYTPSVQKNTANQNTYDFNGQEYSIFDTALTNVFKNTITTNNAGINYRLGRGRDDQLSFGINYQHTQLQSNRVFPVLLNLNPQPFSDFLPNVMYSKKVSKYSRIRIYYRASTNFPSISQLQDVVNLSNPLSVSTGNPVLKQSYTNTLNSRYTYVNTKTSESFFANLMLLTANNYISSGTYIPTTDSTIENNLILKKGSQLTKPVNLNGYQSLRTFFTYSFLVKFIKTTINLNAGFTYSKLPGLINNFNTITNSYAYNGGVVFASNISEYVDFNLSYNASINNSNTNTAKISTSEYINQAAEISFNLLNKKGWFINNDLTANIYNGLSLTAGPNQNFWLWNASIGKKIFKKQTGEIKVSAFDILKQNKSLIHTVTGAYVQDAQTQVLQQYFILTFTYKLKNFGKGPSKPTNNYNRGNRGAMPGGGFGGGRGGDF